MTGAFERVAISTTWYASDGVATSYSEIGPVSGRTRIDESNVGDVAGVGGFVITDVAAFEQGAAEPTISKRNPNLNSCLDQIRPAKVSATVAGCTATGEGGDVTFVYENPNDEALLVRSELAGRSSTAPPDELKPGRHSFVAHWTPENPNDRLRWRLDVRPFGYEKQVTATGPTAAECGVTPETAEQRDEDGQSEREMPTEEGTETTDVTTNQSSNGTTTDDATSERTTQSEPSTSQRTTKSATEQSEPATTKSESAGEGSESTTEASPETTPPATEPKADAGADGGSGTATDAETGG